MLQPRGQRVIVHGEYEAKTLAALGIPLDMATSLDFEPAPYRRPDTLPNPPLEEANSSWPVLGAEVGRNRFGQYVDARRWYATPAMCEPEKHAIELLLRSRAAGREKLCASHASDAEKWVLSANEATGFIG